ncbi:Disulfide-isomerase-like protein [Rhynchospora pubera]|uniref:protein disulfide-isomerase n=1 Tax=Rhynchospora pubera TaxID=906938 RepID=A0AAV8C3I0_9POAL|nr:Disulfide-isomerase-like protein [Rhynchospora pubera]
MVEKKMRRYQVRLALFVTLAFLIAPAIADGDVVELMPDNFQKEVGQDRGALVKFFAPWCGHCIKLAPEYEQLASYFKQVADTVLIAKVNCDENKDLCVDNEVTGYPTILWFPKGSLEAKRYHGIRTIEAFAEFVNAEGGTNVKVPVAPSYVVEVTLESFDDVIFDITKHVFVQFYAPWCGHCHNFAPTYEKVASIFKLDEDVVIARVNGDEYPEVSEKYADNGYPSLWFIPKGNTAVEEYEEGRTVEEIVEFINQKCGTNRDFDGQLTSRAGIVESLDALVKEFVSAVNDEREKIITKIEEEVSKLTGTHARYGKFYVKAAKSILSKGVDYAKAETERLQRMLEKVQNTIKFFD